MENTFNVTISSSGEIVLSGKPPLGMRINTAYRQVTTSEGVLYDVKTVITIHNKLPKYFFECRKLGIIDSDAERGFRILSESYARIDRIDGTRCRVFLRTFNVVSREAITVIVVDGFLKNPKLTSKIMKISRMIMNEKVVPAYREPFIRHLKKTGIKHPGLHIR